MYVAIFFCFKKQAIFLIQSQRKNAVGETLILISGCRDIGSSRLLI